MFSDGPKKENGPDTVAGGANREFKGKIIEALREKLLDLTRRNRTLSFKHSDRARTHIRVIDEIPDFLFKTLVSGKKMPFKPLPEPVDEPKDEKTQEFLDELETARLSDEEFRLAMDALDSDVDNTEAEWRIERVLRDRIREKLGLPVRPHKEMKIQDYAQALDFEPSYDLPEAPGDVTEEKKHIDKYIQTLLFPDTMERKLGGIYQQARSALQEMGVNTLYVAFGFLEWTESDASDEKLFAPLLFLPVAMERKRTQKGYKFSITSTGDEPSINLSLRVKLRKDFGMELPKYECGDDNDTSADTSEGYWAKVADAIESKKGWRIRRFVTVGHFAFSRLVMYEDLDPSNWPIGTSLVEHDVVSQLIAGSDVEPAGAMMAEDYDVDTEAVEAKVPLLITDADSSQFSSIVDVMDGKNLVIKGPPGTGKSQTITNIIGNVLAVGKKVLFVAEKMAALEVVHKRLADAHLGEFCLELHSTKLSKAAVMKSLKDRDEMDQPRDPAQLDARLNEFRHIRTQLTRYADTINVPFGSLGETLQEIVWRTQAADFAAQEAGVCDQVYRWIVQDAALMGVAKVEAARNSLSTLEEASRHATGEWGNPEGHPWHGVRKAELSPYDQEELLEEVASWLKAVRGLTEAFANAAEEISSTRPNTLAETGPVIEGLKNAPAARAQVDSALLTRVGSSSSGSSVLENIQTLTDFCERVKDFREAERDLRSVVEAPAQSADCVCEIRAAVGRLATVVGEYGEMEAIGIVSELPERIATLEEKAEVLGRIDEQAASLFRTFGLKSTRTAKAVLRVVAVADLLVRTDREALIYRTPETVDEAQTLNIQKAQRELTEILDEKRKLSQRYRYRYEDDHRSLQDHAQIIRSKGFFGRLGGTYKQAKLAYIALVGPTSGKAEPQGMAAALEEVAVHLERTRVFLDNAGYRKAAGRHWANLETPFDAISRASAFAERVRTEFTNPDFEEELNLRTFCLEAAQDRIDTIVAPNKRPGYEVMRSQMETLVEEELADSEVPDVIRSWRATAQTLSEAHTTLTDSGVKAGVQISALGEISDRLEVRADAIATIEEDEKAKGILGDAFTGLGTDIERVGITVLAVGEVVDAGLDPAVRDHILQSGDYGDMLERIAGHVSRLETSVSAEVEARLKVSERGHVEMAEFLRVQGVPGATLTRLGERIEFALKHRELLQDWVAFNRVLAQATEAGTRPLLDIYDEAEAPYEDLVKAFDCAFYRSVMRGAFEKIPELTKFSGMTQERLRARFCELDRQILDLHRERLEAQLYSSRIPSGNSYGSKKTWTNLALIRNEYQKQSRIIAIRDLMWRAGAAIRAMKPCFMMSPASVAQFLKQGDTEFDLVVIDEASQMKPEEAIGAIARGRQLVVVGDPMQLPPTTFFEKVGLSADEESEVYEDLSVESILDQAIGIFHPIRDLRWHYRSRHERLISFSNRHFYDDRLIVFPSPTPVHAELGVHQVFVDAPAYKGGLNEPEARKLVDIAIDFMRREAVKPEEERRSLGIATMNIRQRDLVQEMLDRRLAFDDTADEYAAHWEETLEPVFVKNLENVQGDERDVIMISTVYGPEVAGGGVKQRFGPVNGKYGHRRLNVLFTRAKRQVILVTSLRSTDIVVSEKSHEGVGILKRYLQYAETGRIEVGEDTGRDTESAFEEFVKRRLEAHGYDVAPQVGVAGYRIDLAVRHPDNSDHFVLGIECDGATYHSAKSARDRDRIREEVITDLGWRLHRIWSLDWFNNRNKEMERLIKRIQDEISRQHTIGISDTEHAEHVDHHGSWDREKPPLGGAVVPAPDLSATKTTSNVEREYNETSDENLAETEVQEMARREERAPPPSETMPPLTGPHSILPYKTWNSIPLLDPKKTPHKIENQLVEIIEIEGPVVLQRVFHLYAEAAGIKRVTSQLRRLFFRAADIALTSGRIEEERGRQKLELNSVVRPAGSQPVVVRKRGPRSFEEIPSTEIANVVRSITRTHPSIERDALYHRVLDFYDLKRLTSNVRKSLARLLSDEGIDLVEPETLGSDGSPSKPSSQTHSKYKFELLGENFVADSLVGILVIVIRTIQEIDPEFLSRLSQRSGRVRPIVARSPRDLYPGRPDLSHYFREITDGWFVGSNYSKRDVARILRLVCTSVGLVYGEDLRGPAIEGLAD